MGSRGGRPEHSVTLGVTDLMTSLAVIFVLLLVVFASASRSAEEPRERPPAAPEDATARQVRAALERSAPGGLALEADPADAQSLRVVVPESLLHFEVGKSTLSPAAEQFLAETMPAFAVALCGNLREHVAGVVIEGHTDDLGGDAMNLRLSQERSFRVLVRGLEAIRAAAPAAHACFAELTSASGRGKQDLLYDEQRRPARSISRRVVFKILLRSSAPTRA